MDVFSRHHDHIRKLVSDATYHVAVRVATVVYEPDKKKLSQIEKEDQKIITIPMFYKLHDCLHHENLNLKNM